MIRLDSFDVTDAFDCRLDWFVKHINATIHSLDGSNEATKMTLDLRGGGSLTGQRGQLLGNQHDLNFALSKIGCRRYFESDLIELGTRCVEFKSGAVSTK